MGFSRVVLPEANVERASADALVERHECELVGVRTLGEALDQLIA
jgi:hypothetical protein